MTTLYKPVLIESAEQAEALPIGTVAHVDERGIMNYARKVEGWGVQSWRLRTEELEHADLIGWTALVPIEAEEEFGAEMHWFPDGPADKTMTGRARDRENAEWQRDHNPRLATGRVMTRLVTPWEEA